jgi:DNA-binding transcriptional LysR family regulator
LDLHRADLGLLLALDCLIAERSVTKAARKLGISQPALSAQLARLRTLFDDPLLVPSGRQMVLSARASAIRAPLHHLLDELQALVRNRLVFDPSTSSRIFKVRGTDYVHRVILVPVIERLHAAAPWLSLALLSLNARNGWADLESGDCDLLIVSEHLAPEAARARPLIEETFVMIQRKNHPRGTGAIDLEGFCSLEHVLVSPEGGGFVGAIDEVLAAAGQTRRVAVSLPNFLLAPPVVAASDFVAVVPRRLGETFGTLIDSFPIPLPTLSFRVLMCWHPQQHLDPGSQWLRDSLSAAFADGEASARPRHVASAQEKH